MTFHSPSPLKGKDLCQPNLPKYAFNVSTSPPAPEVQKKPSQTFWQTLRAFFRSSRPADWARKNQLKELSAVARAYGHQEEAEACQRAANGEPNPRYYGETTS